MRLVNEGGGLYSAQVRWIPGMNRRRYDGMNIGVSDLVGGRRSATMGLHRVGEDGDRADQGHAESRDRARRGDSGQ